MLNNLIIFGMSANPEASQEQGIMQWIPFIAIIAIIYFLMIRPQSKKAKEQKNMLSSLKKGDKIVTIGGIYGKIAEVKEATLILDTGKGNTIELDRNSISTKVNEENQK